MVIPQETCKNCGKILKRWKLKDATVPNDTGYCNLKCNFEYNDKRRVRYLLTSLWDTLYFIKDEHHLKRLEKHFKRALRKIKEIRKNR